MGKYGSIDIRGFKKLQEELNKMKNSNDFMESCAKELAARLLAKVVRRTPVGDYSREVEVVAKRNSKNHKKGDTYKKKINPSGKMGGTLRRGWTSQTHQEAVSGMGKKPFSVEEAKGYVNSLKVNHSNGFLVIEVINPVEWSSYVEYGHRTPNHKGWVEGHFMMTISEQELQTIAPKVLENKLRKYLEECMK